MVKNVIKLPTTLITKLGKARNFQKDFSQATRSQLKKMLMPNSQILIAF